jgi:hypothetical protein
MTIQKKDSAGEQVTLSAPVIMVLNSYPNDPAKNPLVLVIHAF